MEIDGYDGYINPKRRPELAQSEVIDELPKACADETAAVEFIEKYRWGGTPCCPECGDTNVYKMTGKAAKRFLRRCRGCKKMFSVRTGTVFEESLIPLRHWCYAIWRMSTSKKGVAALEIMRQCQITYKSALFMMHRIRWGMAPDPATAPKLQGRVEADETFVGGKPRKPGKVFHETRKSKKTPVAGCVERGGQIRRRVVADVTGPTLKKAIKEVVDKSATIYTDEAGAYTGIGMDFKGGHHTVNHSMWEYARGDVSTNTMESSFAVLKRGIMGIYHAVSQKHLHRYVSEFDFRWNARFENDGDRVAATIKAAEGKRLLYRQPTQQPKPSLLDGDQHPIWPE